MSTWQSIAEPVSALSYSAFLARIVELFVGREASWESFVFRWLPIVLRLGGLKSDQALLLSLIAEATWKLGCVYCTGASVTRKSGT